MGFIVISLICWVSLFVFGYEFCFEFAWFWVVGLDYLMVIWCSCCLHCFCWLMALGLSWIYSYLLLSGGVCLLMCLWVVCLFVLLWMYILCLALWVCLSCCGCFLFACGLSMWVCCGFVVMSYDCCKFVSACGYVWFVLWRGLAFIGC